MARPKKQALDLGELVKAGTRWLNAQAEVLEYRLLISKRNEEVVKEAQERIIGSFASAAENEAASMGSTPKEIDLASFLSRPDKQ